MKIEISRKLYEALRLSDQLMYEIAHQADMHPTTLSRIMNGIERIKPDDVRVLRLGTVLGLSKAELFEEEAD
jgi:hypothetical protein